MAIKDYNVRFDETVVDIVSKTLKNLNDVYSFIVSNNLSSIEEVLNVGEVLKYDTSLIQFEDTNLKLNPTYINEFKTFKTFENQSIFDLCLNKYGTLNELSTFIVENNFDGIDDNNCNLKSVQIQNSKYDKTYSKNNFVTLYDENIVFDENFLLLNTGSYVLLTNNNKIKLS